MQVVVIVVRQEHLRFAGRIVIIDRIVVDIFVPVKAIFVPDGVGLEGRSSFRLNHKTVEEL